MIKFIKQWYAKKSMGSASDFQLEHNLWSTKCPVTFITALRECKARFGAIDKVSRPFPNKPNSRMYNVSYPWGKL